ncbi:sulfotransferase family 2 domain-containing protein [Alteromonas marina]|uniref:sulfotransferase family 2 domain-containing protein n=1 Tax=Alteromonas sp. OM2203 TaxID=3398817 RepID=UPI003AF3D413
MLGIKTAISYHVKSHLNIYPYRRYMCKHNCIFIHIPKAAGTSVLHALSGSTEHVQRDHCSAFNFKSADKKRFERSFKFAFVRHPVDRLLSVHRYLLSGGNGTNNKRLSALINSEYNQFDDFVLKYLDSMRLHTEVLFRPQFSFLCNEYYEVMVDFVGKYERIDEDFKVVADKLDLSTTLPKSNVSKLSNGSDVSDNVREKIFDLYSKDFELFKY